MTVTILVDPENSAGEWWDALRRLTATLERLAAPVGLTPVAVDADLAPAVAALFRRLPGWADGPAHAPAPVRLDTVPESPEPALGGGADAHAHARAHAYHQSRVMVGRSPARSES
jgi:hypothetical protein